MEDLITHYFASLSRLPSRANIEGFDLQDDAALWRLTKAANVVLSADMLVRGVHFLADTPPEIIAQKAVAVNIADLAAKGAHPLTCLMTLGLPRRYGAMWLQPFAKGLARALRRYKCNLAGGDMVRAPNMHIGLTVLGQRLAPGYTPRRNMHLGDDVYVTGVIGDGWLGLSDARAKRISAARRHYDIPQPPLEFGLACAGHIHASCDISDGLWLDATRLAQASQCGLCLDADRIPLSQAGKAFVRHNGDMRRLLCAGDDYQLLFSAPPSKRRLLSRLARQCKTCCTRIGTVTSSKTVQIYKQSRPLRPPKRLGYLH